MGSVPNAPLRAIHWHNGRAFAVAGGVFIEMFSNTLIKELGHVADDGQAVVMLYHESDGGQLRITSSGKGYTFDLGTNTLSEVTK